MKTRLLTFIKFMIIAAITPSLLACGRVDSTDQDFGPPKELRAMNNTSNLFGTWRAQSSTTVGNENSLLTLHIEPSTSSSGGFNAIVTKTNKCGEDIAEVSSPVFVSSSSIRFPSSTNHLVGNCESSLVASTLPYQIVGTQLTIRNSPHGSLITYTKINNNN